LERNCGGVSCIVPRRAALWSRNTSVRVADDKAENWAFAMKEDRGSGNIPTITIPELIREAGVPSIDILKIDIEGAEKELFSNDSSQWLPRVRLIIIELHDRFVPGCSRAFYTAITQYGFTQEVRGENVFVSLETNPTSA
jgi:FkbM family methyltransferase